jgi:hypothetical protein
MRLLIDPDVTLVDGAETVFEHPGARLVPLFLHERPRVVARPDVERVSG